MSNASVLLPLPDTPVITVKRSRGMRASMFFKLCSRAWCTQIILFARSALDSDVTKIPSPLAGGGTGRGGSSLSSFSADVDGVRERGNLARGALNDAPPLPLPSPARGEGELVRVFISVE